MKQSNFLSLGWRDFLRGLIIAILTPVLVIIQQSLDTGSLIFNWQTIGYSAIAGGVAYLLKNILTSPDSKPISADDIGGGGIKNPPPPGN